MCAGPPPGSRRAPVVGRGAVELTADWTFGRGLASGGMADAAGIVLAGGRSSRMGTPKAALTWHGSTLLGRVCGLVARAVAGPVVVVRAPGQPLPALPAGVQVVDDPVEGRGPLQGIVTGLAAL